jgi:hypothetical protein
MRFPRCHAKDGLFLCGLFLMVALSFLVGFALYSVPGAIAASIDVAAILLCAGKTLGKRLGLRSSFWQSPLTTGEWIVLILVLLYVNLTAFWPEVRSIGVLRQTG